MWAQARVTACQAAMPDSSPNPSMVPNISAVSMLSSAALRTSSHSTVMPAAGHTVANSWPGMMVLRAAHPSTEATTRNPTTVRQPGRSGPRPTGPVTGRLTGSAIVAVATG